MRKQEFEGRYHYEIAAGGLTVTVPDGTVSFVPWTLFSPVRESSERFFLSTRRSKGGTVLILPKRALSDQSSVRRLGEFLRESAGREAPPA